MKRILTIGILCLGTLWASGCDPHHDEDLRPTKAEVKEFRESLIADKFVSMVEDYASYPIEYEQLKPITVAQWLLETGRGHSFLAQSHNNFGGMKWREELASIPGNYPLTYTSPSDNEKDLYVHTESTRAWFKTYWTFIDRPVYAGWRQHTATGEQFLRYIKQKNYAMDKDYVSKVLANLEDAKRLLRSAGWQEPMASAPQSLESNPETEVIDVAWLSTIRQASRWNACNHYGVGSDRSGRPASSIKKIVVHNTVAGNWGDNQKLADTVNSYACGSRRASFHYVIGVGGSIVRMVPDLHVAWHAPGGNMDGIGIEVDTTKFSGTSKNHATPEQMAALKKLVRTLMKKYGLTNKNISMHRLVSGYNHTNCADAIWDVNEGRRTGEAAFYNWRDVILMDGLPSDIGTGAKGPAKVLSRIRCAEGFQLEEVGTRGGRACLSRDEIAGPFPDGMIQECLKSNPEDVCTQKTAWSREFGLWLRGDDLCPRGTSYDERSGYCADSTNAYGPFPEGLIQLCLSEGGGEPCSGGKWHKAFLASIMERYKPRYYAVKTFAADLYNKPVMSSAVDDPNQETQALYNDLFEVESVSKGWVYGRLLAQSNEGQRYQGYMRIEDLTPAEPRKASTVRAFSTLAPVYRDPELKREAMKLPMGADVNLLEAVTERELFKVELADGTMGYVKYSDARLDAYQPKAEDELRASIVLAARSLIGTPYLWGGMAPYEPSSDLTTGLDASALPHLAYRASGFEIPRNGRDQAQFGSEVKFSELKPGDIIAMGQTKTSIFHILLYIGQGELIEASGAGDEDIKISSIYERFDKGLSDLDRDPRVYDLQGNRTRVFAIRLLPR